MFSYKTLIVAASGLLVVIVAFGWIWPQSHKSVASASAKSTHASVSLASDSRTGVPYNVLVNKDVDISGRDTIKNSHCGFTFKIPTDWSVTGVLGESIVRSPQDQFINSEYAKSHPNQQEDGEALIGPDARSVSMGCRDGVKTYIVDLSELKGHSGFADKNTLAEVFASDAFHSKNSNLALVKTLSIDGQIAYELSDTVKMPDGTFIKNYEIVTRKEDRVYEIGFGQIEYEKLSESVKQIINSISF